jgi:hypothetical protein
VPSSCRLVAGVWCIGRCWYASSSCVSDATSTALQRSTELQLGSLHQPQRLSAFSEHGSVQAPARWLAHPALVCFATQIQGKAVSRRAWPNPSFKRTRLRRSA